MSLSYTTPQARAIKRVAAREDYRSVDGQVDIKAVAAAARVSVDVVTYVLTGELPGGRATTPPPPPEQIVMQSEDDSCANQQVTASPAKARGRSSAKQ